MTLIYHQQSITFAVFKTGFTIFN